MHGYVEGYRRAAVALFRWAVETHESPERVVFPLAFLWRHHIELALKEIIAVGRQVRGEPWGHPSGHRLRELWDEAKAHLAACGAEAAHLANVETNIDEFAKVDPGADGFRFPLNLKQTGVSMPEAPSHVNLAVLNEAMQALANFFEAGRSELGARRDHVLEMMAGERES